MALLYDWVAETANSPGTSTNVSLLGALNGSYKTFASKAANGSQVYYTISDETSMRECGIGTFTSPSTLSRDTVLANTLGTTARMNFIGTVVVYNDIPASKALFFDASGNIATIISLTVSGSVTAGTIIPTGQINQSGAGWVNTMRADTSSTALLINQVASTPNATGMVVDLESVGSFFTIWTFAGAVKGSINTNGSVVAYNVSSDETLKIHDRFVEPSESGHIIDGLQPRWFRWKASPEKTSEIGFFAQQVNEVFPKAVTEGHFITNPEGDSDKEDHYIPWGLDEAKLMSVVIAELKALRARVTELETELGRR